MGQEFRLTISKKEDFLSPEGYILDDNLFKAVEVALTLGQPLLITGEPGTGKTRLAHKIALMLHEQTKGVFKKDPFEFFTKTSAVSSDLFYQYDALGHFHEANLKEKTKSPDARKFIRLEALGAAIAMSDEEHLGDNSYMKEAEPHSSVVLIDEIDKAPRDFPNDILNEIDRFQFSIKETGETFKKGKDQRIIVVMTSNTEKNLPDAFLRRCVYYHIDFPNPEQLFNIVSTRLTSLVESHEDAVRSAIRYFNQVRQKVNRRPPATAELLAWLKILEVEGFMKSDLDFAKLSDEEKNILTFSHSVLVKNKADLDLLD